MSSLFGDAALILKGTYMYEYNDIFIHFQVYSRSTCRIFVSIYTYL
jgi:hypothetical protein